VIRHRSKKTCTATRLLTLAAAICFPSLTLACALSESPLELDANAGEDVVIAGYDYVLDGKLVLRETVVKEIPRTTAIPMAMTWTGSGRFSVSLFGEEPRTVETQLRAGVLFAAASSAKAKFALSAGSFL
jgi:hypothetical protein